jgi:hypothetical protein
METRSIVYAEPSEDCGMDARSHRVAMWLIAFYLILTDEAVGFKKPVCCYRGVEQVFVCERELCESLMKKSPDVSMENLLPDGECVKK